MFKVSVGCNNKITIENVNILIVNNKDNKNESQSSQSEITSESQSSDNVSSLVKEGDENINSLKILNESQNDQEEHLRMTNKSQQA